FGNTALVNACQAAQIPFEGKQAHSALYATERTAELFCYMVNHLKDLGGFPHIAQTDETEKTDENQTAL
ncbi:MAG: ribonuclease T, partial [Haemophilus parainfluenzae]|nr:ribonuclease T [Haemophilus parainfluenzae]